MNEEIKNENKTAQQERDILIQGLKERLIWYTYDAPTDDFNIREIQVLVSLLRVLDPMELPECYNPQSGLERFREYVDRRQAEEAGISITDGELVTDKMSKKDIVFSNSDESSTKGILNNIKKVSVKPFRIVKGTLAAASLALVVFAGSTMYSRADIDTGFFHWFKKDAKGEEMLLIPIQEEEINQPTSNRYYNEEEVPLEYRAELWVPENLDESWEFECVDVVASDNVIMLTKTYVNSIKELRLNIGINLYQNKMMYQRNIYINYKYLSEKEIKDKTVEFYQNPKSEDADFALVFYNGVRQYSIEGNIAIEELEKIAVEYVTYVNNK